MVIASVGFLCSPNVLETGAMRLPNDNNRRALGSIFTFALLALACQSGGVGDPCTPEEEFLNDFTGFSAIEASVQSRSYECETRVCLVNKFQGRVSCPYGTNGDAYEPGTPETVEHGYPCQVPGAVAGTNTIVPVQAQLTERPPEDAVYCSCRCSGADPNARYCECPSGFECTDIGLTNVTQRGGEITGSYCVRSGTNVDRVTISLQECRLPDPGQPPSTNELTCGDGPPGFQ
jgi:hypothetical protein